MTGVQTCALPISRYAAYIVIERDKRIAVIEAPNGAFFLPGGEIEGEETKEEDRKSVV